MLYVCGCVLCCAVCHVFPSVPCGRLMLNALFAYPTKCEKQNLSTFLPRIDIFTPQRQVNEIGSQRMRVPDEFA